MTAAETLSSATRPIRPALAAVLRSLKPGQRIRITQTVRMNSRWHFKQTVEGVFREVNYLRTGLATDRVPEDDVIVVTVHFTKDNGELSSVTLDDSTQIEVVGNAA
jgi:azurin